MGRRRQCVLVLDVVGIPEVSDGIAVADQGRDEDVVISGLLAGSEGADLLEGNLTEVLEGPRFTVGVGDVDLVRQASGVGLLRSDHSLVESPSSFETTAEADSPWIAAISAVVLEEKIQCNCEIVKPPIRPHRPERRHRASSQRRDRRWPLGVGPPVAPYPRRDRTL